MNASLLKGRGDRWRYPILDSAARRLPAPAARGAAVVVCTPGHLGDVLHAVPQTTDESEFEYHRVWLERMLRPQHGE